MTTNVYRELIEAIREAEDISQNRPTRQPKKPKKALNSVNSVPTQADFRNFQGEIPDELLEELVWHRHPNEPLPEYHWGRCRAFLQSMGMRLTATKRQELFREYSNLWLKTYINPPDSQSRLSAAVQTANEWLRRQVLD